MIIYLITGHFFYFSFDLYVIADLDCDSSLGSSEAASGRTVVDVSLLRPARHGGTWGVGGTNHVVVGVALDLGVISEGLGPGLKSAVRLTMW